MEQKFIGINDFEMNAVAGLAFSFDGVFSGKKLAGIKLDFRVYGADQEDKIEELLQKERVTVKDPFIQRTYESSIRMLSSSFQEGKDEKSYVIELREIDSLPKFDFIEINDNRFNIISYKEELLSDAIGRYALLRLSKDHFDQLSRMLREPTIKFKRIGVDDKPFELRFGGGMYWSQHSDHEGEYFKRIVSFFPPDLKESNLNLATGNIQSAMAHMLISLSLRFELLVKELATSQVISDEKKESLLSSHWKESVPIKQIDELYDKLELVEDAEKEF